MLVQQMPYHLNYHTSAICCSFLKLWSNVPCAQGPDWRQLVRTVLALFSRCQLCLPVRVLQDLASASPHPSPSYFKWESTTNSLEPDLLCVLLHQHPFRTAYPSFCIATGTIVLCGWETRVSFFSQDQRHSVFIVWWMKSQFGDWGVA